MFFPSSKHATLAINAKANSGNCPSSLKIMGVNDGRRLTCPTIHQIHSSLVQENCWENKPYTPFKFMMVSSMLVALLLMQPQERYITPINSSSVPKLFIVITDKHPFLLN